MTVAYLLSFGLIVHLVLLFSIFDIYFKSPIITSIGPVINNVFPPGKRVVLISVDGLRADALFEKDPATSEYVAKYVQEVMKHRGSWGVSQSRVPTESRPGHVAMLAGIYEDPSAVTKGWKENPVDFDSVFNRSRCSFAWGSPDIISIFFKGLRHNCAFSETYAHEQDFSGDTKEYDNWVFNKLEKFMKESANIRTVLHEKGIFFFLHLLGQDTSGHTDKPRSKKYKENLKNVDNIIEKVEHLFYDFYGDDKTTYIMTSDHGMTDWGSHGSGDADETDTPIVAWGAGIKKPSSTLKQIYISQADITPLLAVLLGVPIPVNSVGTLPIAFLNMSRKQIAEAIEVNARQMVAQFLKAQQDKKEQILPWFHKPFRKLFEDEVNSRFSSIKKAIILEKYSEAIKESKILIDITLEGLKYYQNYYQRCLLLSVGLSYMGWVVYLVLVLVQDQSPNLSVRNSKYSTVVFAVSVLLTVSLISSQMLPWSFYCYLLLPQVLWFLVFRKGSRVLASVSAPDKKRLFQIIPFVVFAVEVLVVSFFKRWFVCLSVGIILCWSFFTWPKGKSSRVRTLWLTSGVVLAAFPLLPTIGSHPLPLVTAASGVGLWVLSLATAVGVGSTLIRERVFHALCFLFLILAVCNNYIVHNDFNESHEVSDRNRYLSWFLLFSSCCFLRRIGTDVFRRLINVFLNVCVPFILLSITYEVLFFTILFVHIFCWIFVEESMNTKHSTLSLFRIAYFFLTYIFLSFFGLGNISSLNSFDPAWVRCFLTVFSPFLMSFLILLKTVIPFLVVTCTLKAATHVLKVSPSKIFIIVLIYCNIMAFNFLFLVKNEGSWLDIGMSISHYVIQQVTIVFLVLLYGLANFLMIPSVDVNTKKMQNKLNEPLEKSLPIFYPTSRDKMH